MEGTGFVTAGELQCGDLLRLADERNIPVKQKGFEYLEEPVLVYNFEVEDFHTYYVSGLGVLVHSICQGAGSNNPSEVIEGTSYDINKIKRTQPYAFKNTVKNIKNKF